MPKAHRERDKAPSRQPQSSKHTERTTQACPVDWKEWWPFERATGNALKQLNKRQPKSTGCLDDIEDALL